MRETGVRVDATGTARADKGGLEHSILIKNVITEAQHLNNDQNNSIAHCTPPYQRALSWQGPVACQLDSRKYKSIECAHPLTE
jgi:hypothetical protein